MTFFYKVVWSGLHTHTKSDVPHIVPFSYILISYVVSVSLVRNGISYSEHAILLKYYFYKSATNFTIMHFFFVTACNFTSFNNIYLIIIFI